MGLKTYGLKLQKWIVKITSNACNNQQFTSPMPKAWHQCVMVRVKFIPLTAKTTSSGAEHTDLKASNLALITNIDIEKSCIWQQNSTVKHISFKK